MKVLIDANVVLDVLLNRTPWVTDSQEVWNANHSRQVQGYLVATSITNLFYIARKLVGQSLAMRGVSDCLAAFEIVPIDKAILANAAVLPGSDFEDNVMICSAVAAQMDAIVTRNLPDFAHSPIPAVSPGDLLSRIRTGSP